MQLAVVKLLAGEVVALLQHLIFVPKFADCWGIQQGEQNICGNIVMRLCADQAIAQIKTARRADGQAGHHLNKRHIGTRRDDFNRQCRRCLFPIRAGGGDDKWQGKRHIIGIAVPLRHAQQRVHGLRVNHQCIGAGGFIVI